MVAAAGAYVPQPLVDMGKTYDALVDRASPYLPATLSSSLTRRRLAVPPQVQLEVRRLGAGRAEAPELLSLPASTALGEAQLACQRMLGIPPEQQLLCVEGGRGSVENISAPYRSRLSPEKGCLAPPRKCRGGGAVLGHSGAAALHRRWAGQPAARGGLC